MDSGSIPLWLLLIFFILAGAYFAAAESGFSAVNKIRIKARADEGSKRARGVLYILNHFEKALTTLLVGNNITHIAAASVATLLATRVFRSQRDTTSFGFTMLCTVVSTAVIFLFSEMIPKSFANDRSETTSLGTQGSLRFLMKVFTPLSAVFGGVATLASRWFAGDAKPSITEDELGDIIETAEEEGVVDEEQSEMLRSALQFGDTVVGDVMTMAKDIEAINVNATNAEVLAVIRESNHSRLPVYTGSPDHVIGTLRVRRFLTEYRQTAGKVKLRSMLAKPYFVRENAMIDDVLSDMRQHKHHMAIVTDEAGRAIGIVTIEDFLEELVGEIFDEEDEVDENFQPLGGNKYLVNTKMLMGEIYARIGLAAAPRALAPQPLLALIIGTFHRIPAEDESFVFDTRMEVTVHTVENDVPVMAVVHVMDDNDLAERQAAAEGEVAQ